MKYFFLVSIFLKLTHFLLIREDIDLGCKKENIDNSLIYSFTLHLLS